MSYNPSDVGWDEFVDEYTQEQLDCFDDMIAGYFEEKEGDLIIGDFYNDNN